MVNSNILHFPSCQEAQQALSQLRDAGFPGFWLRFATAKGAEFNKQLGGADMHSKLGTKLVNALGVIGRL